MRQRAKDPVALAMAELRRARSSDG